MGAIRNQLMKRGAWVLALLVILLNAEVIFLAVGPAHSVEEFRRLHLDTLVSLLLSLLSAAVGVLGVLTLRRRTGVMAKKLSAMAEAVHLERVDSTHPDLAALTYAVNELVDCAENAVGRARLEVKELELQLKVATSERQHAEAIIYSISDAVLVTDPFDELLVANEAAARTFGFELKDSARAPIGRILRDPKMIDIIREMRQSDSRSERRVVEHDVATAAGTRSFKITLSCVKDRPDQPAGVVAVLHDMTREKEVAEMKNDFVSNVSHELRTPLASIKAYVEMLIDGEAEDEKTKHEFYEVIQNEGNRLSRLIDDILNISRIESGLIKVNKQPQSLTIILKEALEVIGPQARQKRITIDDQLSPVFYQVVVDKDMCYQAVLNLLSNAVKYTPEGGTVSVQAVVDETAKTVTTRISDTGVGIPEKDLPMVFDKFFRVEANNKMAKGTGLGLTLVKQIIETVHHGRLFVESTVGKGTTFGFELKLAE